MAKGAANSTAKLYLQGLAPMPTAALLTWSPFRNRPVPTKADLVPTSVTHRLPYAFPTGNFSFPRGKG